jgi:aminoacylase
MGEDPAVSLFREYIRIESVQPKPDYDGIIKFLSAQAEILDLSYQVVCCVPEKPIFIMTWPGTEPDLPAILLNSHTDVVPVFPEHWTYPPFSAHKDEKGNIYGRGTQDMKCVGMQHLEAVRRLKNSGVKLKRTVHLSFVPDEEIGGHDGMQKFVQTPDFKKLNIGFGLDEGIAVPGETMPVFYGERNVFWIEIICPGSPGHGSRFLENNAALKAQYMMNKLLEYRAKEKARLESDPTLTLGDVTTVNLNIMKGGVQANVVPDKYELTFDIRITPTTKIDEFEKMIRDWMAEAGEGLELRFIQKFTDQTLTPTSPEDPWISALTKGFQKHNLKTKNEIFPAGTDSRYLREVGIPAIGFSPMPNTPTLLHDHDEFLDEKIFLKGIDIFTDLVQNLASV